jgi:hypothetical protein
MGGTIAKGTGATVSKPAAASKTYTSVTVAPVTVAAGTNQTVEYAISLSASDPLVTYGNTATFTGLTPGATCYIYARTKENGNYDAGAVQVSDPVVTDAPPSVAVTAVTGLDNLKAGVPVNGSITCELVGGTFESMLNNSGNDFKAFTGLPVWLTAGTVTRDNDTKVTITLTGTPTAASTNPAVFDLPAVIPAANVTNWSGDLVLGGQLTVGAVAKGDGADVDAAPTGTSTVYHTVTVNPGTSAGALTTGQAVEYAIAAAATPLPATWQSGTTFTALTANTAYYVFARTAENASYNAGTPKMATVTTLNGPAITVSSVGLDNLKVDMALNAGAAIVYTLSNAVYESILPNAGADFAVALVPNGLTAGTPVRKDDNTVTVSITGTPASASISAPTFAYATNIPGGNVANIADAVTVGGSLTAGPIVKGVGAAVSTPVVSTPPVYGSITVDPVTIAPGTDQARAQYAVSTSSAATVFNWQDGETISGLNPATTYYVYARAKESNNYEAGAVSAVSAPVITRAAPAIAAVFTGLTGLKVGAAASGSIVYTLSSGNYANPLADADAFRTAGNLPAGLTETVTRTGDTQVTVTITGAPTTADAGTVTIVLPTVSAGNVEGWSNPVTVSGTATASAVARGDGAPVSGTPTVNGAPAHNSITVNAVANAGTTGQDVEYAVSTQSGTTPASGWQAGTTFSSLNASTNYYVYARTKANNNYEAGAAQQSTGITTAAAPAYGVTLDVSGTHTFPSATVGYGAQTPLTVTVTNTGNVATGALQIALSGAGSGNFTLSTATVGNIAVGGNMTFTVVPNTGLVAGASAATVTVNGGNGISETFDVAFTVFNATFIAVTDITDVPATATVGTDLKLTATVNPANATNRTIDWNIANAGTTGAAISGNTLSAVAAGTVIVRATIVNGVAAGTDFTKDFSITVNAVSYSIHIAGLSNGSISAAPAQAAAGETVTLTVSPNSGYELSTIQAYRTGMATAQIPLSGSGNTRTFTMPAGNVTVTAVFASAVDQQAISSARTLIANATFSAAQTTVNTLTALRSWLATQLNGQIRSTGVTVTPSDILITGFAAAIAGNASMPAGAYGSFRFKVTLTQGAATLTTDETAGVIVATPHVTAPVKRIELRMTDATTVRIINTGNVETGHLTAALSGVHADAFTLSTSAPGSLSAGSEQELTVTLRTNLAPGVYTATLTVSAPDLASVSQEITGRIISTGNETVSAFKVWASGNRLCIAAAQSGKAHVYSTGGLLIKTVDCRAGETAITALPQGFYVVIVGDRRQKVMIKE